MDARLKIIEPDGTVISDIHHHIPFAKSPDSKKYYRNFLFIGEYVYNIKEDGEIVSVLPDRVISKKRMAEIRALHAERVAQINKQCL